MQGKIDRIGKPALVFVLIAAGAAAAFAVDMPVHRFVAGHIKPSLDMQLVGQVISGLEEFGQLVPIVAISAAVWRLDRRHGRKVMVRILLAAVLASLACEACKAAVGRHRPRWFREQTWSQTWIDAGVHPRSGKEQSFFSGHTSAAFAMAAVVGMCYPPVAPVVGAVAMGCGASRIAVQQHWTSDVYIGAVMGMAVGWWFVPNGMRKGLTLRRVSSLEGQLQSSN